MRPFQHAGLSEIEALYRSRFRHFVRVARAIVGDEQLALEAVQDAFAGAVRSRRRYRGEGPLEAWLWRAVVNAAQKTRLREARSALPAEPEGRHNGRPAVATEVTTAIALLPERQRLALFLRYYADLDYRGIADALGVEVGTVSATLSAAHSSVRRALEEVPR